MQLSSCWKNERKQHVAKDEDRGCEQACLFIYFTQEAAGDCCLGQHMDAIKPLLFEYHAVNIYLKEKQGAAMS